MKEILGVLLVIIGFLSLPKFIKDLVLGLIIICWGIVLLGGIK